MLTKNDSDVRISDEGDYQLAVKVLGARARPSWILRLLMNALESYRQSRKMGWSRPQNKYGVTVFSAYELTPADDADIVAAAFGGVDAEFATELTDADRSFLTDLRADAGLMGFLFVHDMVDGDRRFEGMTYSFGRRATGEARFRDRFDIIVESEVLAQGSGGLSRVRAYIDPFRRPIEAHPLHAMSHDQELSVASGGLFEQATELHRTWSLQSERHWRHWTSDYIDYFGPRSTAVVGTFFPTFVDVAAGIRATG